MRIKGTLARTVAFRRAGEERKLFKKIWIHASRDIIINTGGEDETGNPRFGRGHWVTGTCYNRKTLNLKLTRLLSRGIQ